MGEAVEQLDFETAALLRDEIYALEGRSVESLERIGKSKAKNSTSKHRRGR